MSYDMSDSVVERLSICRCCSVACGIIVSVAGDQILEVRGDPDHPLSHGYTCPKGRGLAQFHHHPNRLDGPLLFGRPTDWTSCLDDLAARCRSLISSHGPGALGYYPSTGHYTDTTGWTTEARFMRAATRPHNCRRRSP